MNYKKTALIALLLMSNEAFSGQGKEGGDPIKAKENIDNANYQKVFNDIKIMIASESIKKRMGYILEKISEDKPEEFSFNLSELADDIKKSPYRIANTETKESCVDLKGDAKFATARMHESAGEVCFDLSKIFENKHLITYEEFLAVAFHEHLHHIGIVDKEHKLGVQLATTIENLPWNIMYGDCKTNLLNNMDSFNYRLYADDFNRNGTVFENDSDEFQAKSTWTIKQVYQLSACNAENIELKIKCKNIDFGTIDTICRAETREGFMYLTEDMLGYMQVNFMRWD